MELTAFNYRVEHAVGWSLTWWRSIIRIHSNILWISQP